MPNREKVIKKLEECLSASCRGFRIGKPAPILRDVVEQEMQNMRRRLLTAVAWTDGGAGK